ncbi:MAG: cation transporter [Parvularculaceae bacterium]|nr:cation transporter [Parvularculaceae bacterium]
MSSHGCNHSGGGHQHCHHHHHGHVHAGSSTRQLTLALCVIAGFAALEVVGGLISGSLALLADAGHMVTDAAALALALSAQWLAAKKPTDRFQFGLKRAQVLAAFVNGLGLLAVVAILAFEAIGRFGQPIEIKAGLMLGVALVGLAANGVAFRLLHSHADDNVNVRGALLHVLADIFGSVAAVVSALIIMATGFMAIDAILTLLVCGLILRSAVPLVMETGAVLMQAAPASVVPSVVADELKAKCDVADVHAVRAWELTPGETMMSLRVVLPSNIDLAQALEKVSTVLKEQFAVADATVQIEITDEVVSLPGHVAADRDQTTAMPSSGQDA